MSYDKNGNRVWHAVVLSNGLRVKGIFNSETLANAMMYHKFGAQYPLGKMGQLPYYKVYGYATRIEARVANFNHKRGHNGRVI
jgi:hypothetical protein